MLRIRNTLLVALGFAQIAASAAIFAWALPLFLDPPILGNGIRDSARQIAKLAVDSLDAYRLLRGAEALQWLFARHAEALFVMLATAAFLLISGILSVWSVAVGIAWRTPKRPED